MNRINICILFIFTWILSGITLIYFQKSSKKLEIEAIKYCKKESELDGNKYYCQASYIIKECNFKNYDLKICGIVK